MSACGLSYFLYVSVCGPPRWADPLHKDRPIPFLPCPPVAFLDGPMRQCEHTGWVNCHPMPSLCVYLWPSTMGRSPTLRSAHTIPMVSSCGPPGWAHASVRTYWLERKGDLSADAFFTCLSVALLNGLIPYHDVGPYSSYVPLAEIHRHVFYTKSTHPLQHIIHVMWLKDVRAYIIWKYFDYPNNNKLIKAYSAYVERDYRIRFCLLFQSIIWLHVWKKWIIGQENY